MKDSRRIVICGASIYILAIESGLAAKAEGDVVRINLNHPDTIERVLDYKPSLVILERNGKNDQNTLENLSQDIPLIVLDEARRSVTVLAKDHVAEVEIGELTHMIKKINGFAKE
jgi:ABC-type Fe3+-hydroxamate transport system substrate-binding protein